MATTTHTISIRSNPAIQANTVSAKRVSKSRAYSACVVATATQALVDDRAARVAAAKAGLEQETLKLSDLVIQYGMTLAAAEAKHQVDVRTWFDLREATRKTILAELGRTYHTGIDNLVADRLKAEGHSDPYTKGTYYDILLTAWEVKKHTHAIEHYSKPVAAGDQLVVTWSRDAGLAQKALASHSEHYCKNGHYTLAVRTDITITTK